MFWIVSAAFVEGPKGSAQEILEKKTAKRAFLFCQATLWAAGFIQGDVRQVGNPPRRCCRQHF